MRPLTSNFTRDQPYENFMEQNSFEDKRTQNWQHIRKERPKSIHSYHLALKENLSAKNAQMLKRNMHVERKKK